MEIEIAIASTKEDRAVARLTVKVQELKAKLADAQAELKAAKTKAQLSKKMAKRTAGSFVHPEPKVKPPRPTSSPGATSTPKATGVAFDSSSPELKLFKKYDKSMKGKKWQNILNANAKQIKPYDEGFWRSSIKDRKTPLPFPVAYTPSGYRKKEFIAQLEAALKKASRKAESGFSPHRWTGEHNGGSTYYLRDPSTKATWRVPQGYITYVRAGVPPSRNFYKFITGQDLPSLPDYS